MQASLIIVPIANPRLPTISLSTMPSFLGDLPSLGSIVATSTTEAESEAHAMCAAEVLYACKLCMQLGFTQLHATDLTNLGYPQVPGSIPAKTPSTQINVDLSK